MARLQAMYGDDFHPIMNMAKNAHDFQKIVNSKYENIDPDEPCEHRGSDLIEANKLWEGIAQYVEPKLKAVEISGDPEKPLEHNHTVVTFVGVNADSN